MGSGQGDLPAGGRTVARRRAGPEDRSGPAAVRSTTGMALIARDRAIGERSKRTPPVRRRCFRLAGKPPLTQVAPRRHFLARDACGEDHVWLLRRPTREVFMGKTALVLSGGGAKGAFQIGAEKYAREVKGYDWDLLAGVSVGALNAVMLAMERYQRLEGIWRHISNRQVYRGGVNIWRLIKILFGRRSFFDNDPLQRMIDAEVDVAQIRKPVQVGAVDLVTGRYMRFRPRDPNFKQAVLASTVMPVIWEPTAVGGDLRHMVDGGLRNITPLGDVLEEEAGEIVIINCNPRGEVKVDPPPADIVDIAKRSLDIALSEIFVNDLREFLRINGLVRQAEAAGTTLRNAEGRVLRHYTARIIEPDAPLGDTLDFSREAIAQRIDAGWKKAREVLG
ncbi:MAG: patatin [Candidatus Eisenbacteria bacterium]|nr:patatin [Candidatus Eisenbacteria bacterium]